MARLNIKDLKKISSISRICFETPCKSRTYLNQHVSSKCFICYSLNYQGYIKFLLKSASFLIAVSQFLNLKIDKLKKMEKYSVKFLPFCGFINIMRQTALNSKYFILSEEYFHILSINHCFLKQKVLVDFRYLFRASPTYFWQQIMMFYIL